jgi:tetratricopeptide (TPR) repeat protein/mono/diheme cytochrome c family protein
VANFFSLALGPSAAGACVAVTLASTAFAQPNVTFNKDIAPILFGSCASCHRPGEIAPFSLLTYEDARPRAAAILRAVRDRSMPPWKPEPGYGSTFVGERRLSDQQVDTIRKWVDEGTVRGDAADLPPPPKFAEGWRLGQPDLIVSLAEPYRLKAGGADVLRNVVIPVQLPEPRYVRALEFRPGNARVVHHANIRVDRSGASRALDAQDREIGFDGFVTTASFPDGEFLGWTPGQLAPPVPPGMAWRLEARSDLVVQLHMQPLDTEQLVQPSIGLFFTREPPGLMPVMLRLGRHTIDIAPGLAQYESRDSYVIPIDADVTAIQPHAHFRAKEIRGFALLPDGTRRWLILIRDWDFNWQDLYRLSTPLPLPKGTTLVMEYEYDNSAANRRNPDRPPKRVRWGETSEDEMGDLWLQVRPRSSADRARLLADFGPKVMAEDAAGYEKMLEADPASARLHEAAAAIDLLLGRPETAEAHLDAALRIDPESVESHYNLATALVRRGQLAEAEVHLRRVLQIQPDHVAAHVNLGAVLRMRNQPAEARTHLQRALELDPGNAAAHTNLGGTLAAERRLPEAISEYRLALRSNPDLLEPLTGLAWILATSRDPSVRRPAEAVRLAERAVLLTGEQDVRALETSAAAYAANNQFAKAVDAQQRAIGVATLNRMPDAIVESLRARLDLYRRDVPYYEP